MTGVVQHRRTSIRLKKRARTDPGAYFVTTCTRQRAHLCDHIVDGEMVMNKFGEIVWTWWRETPHHFPHVELDTFTLMPSHTHDIIVIVGATHASPLRGNASPPRGLASGSLGAIVGSFKSAATRGINALRHTSGARLRQRDYYEHIIDLMPNHTHGIFWIVETVDVGATRRVALTTRDLWHRMRGDTICKNHPNGHKRRSNYAEN